jgi:hypothetical protein
LRKSERDFRLAASGLMTGSDRLAIRRRWIAFVGKEAYRGVFGERPESAPSSC